MRSLLVAALLLLSTAAAGEGNCAGDSRVVDACYTVHARLRVHANSRQYLWPVGTERLLAVSFATDAPRPDPPLPAIVADLINLETEVFGDFTVCPFMPEVPGRLRIVCVQAATRLFARPLPP